MNEVYLTKLVKGMKVRVGNGIEDFIVDEVEDSGRSRETSLIQRTRNRRGLSTIERFRHNSKS